MPSNTPALMRLLQAYGAKAIQDITQQGLLEVDAQLSLRSTETHLALHKTSALLRHCVRTGCVSEACVSVVGHAGDLPEAGGQQSA